MLRPDRRTRPARHRQKVNVIHAVAMSRLGPHMAYGANIFGGALMLVFAGGLHLAIHAFWR